MNKLMHSLLVVPICSALVFISSEYAHGNPTVEDGPCPPLNIRTDIRPDVNGQPTKVTIGVYMIDLMEINDISQTLTGDFAVIQTWVDPRLSQREGCGFPLTDIWYPELVFMNSGRKFTGRPKTVDIGPDGKVKYIQRYSGSFATYHNLNHFPFDKQVFTLSLISSQRMEDELQLVVDEKGIGQQERLNISDWSIKDVSAEVGRRYNKYVGKFQSRFDFHIPAERIKSYYLWKVIMPLCLIVAMSWCVFWINPAQYGPQIGLSATSMLTLIAFIFATTNMVPRLGYLTLLDRFIVGSTILVFLALFESLVAVYLVSVEKEALALRIDKVSRLIFPLAFGALIGIVLIV